VSHTQIINDFNTISEKEEAKMIRRPIDPVTGAAVVKPTTFAQRCLQVAILPFVFYVAINFLFRVSYTVHERGVIVISGASTGIGRDAAQKLAQRGYHVFAGVRKDSDAESIRAAQIATLHPLMLDVASHESCVTAINEVHKFASENNLPLVALINNAGVARMQTAEFQSLDDARSVFDTNFFGALDLVQQTLPMLRESKGRILMISSAAGFVATPLYGAYSGSKFALEGFTDSLRREVADFGISVSIIQPGYVKTAITGKQDMSAEIAPLYTKTGARENFSGEEVTSIYSHLYTERARDKKKKDLDSASDVQVTTDAILHAISHKYPLTRYTVASGGGMPTSVVAWIMWALPDRVKDFVIAKLT
jgi:NAD(P)-dependent dehydrogenase (short-subunit alcohol dehydrogenase family)